MMMRLFMPRQPRVLRAAHLAWLAREVCVTGIWARERGSCLGLLRAAEVHWNADGFLERAQRRTSGRSEQRRVAGHLREGHDRSCWALGVPRAALQQLLRAWGSEVSAAAIQRAIELSAEEIAALPSWEARQAREHVMFHLGRLITPLRPPDPEVDHEGRNVQHRSARFRDLPRTELPRGDPSPG